MAQFSRLPGIGLKTAERLVIHLAGRPRTEVQSFSRSLQTLADRLTSCGSCGNYTEADPCEICRNTARDPRLLCVVAKPQDLLAIERSGDFTGRYHVLGGTVDALEGVSLEQLRVDRLVQRIDHDQVREVVLAFNPDVAGEGTVLALKHALRAGAKIKPLKITKLARGLPLGADVEYADEVTLSHALAGRTEL